MPEIYKPKAISGYPEWLPEQRAIEIKWLDKLRKLFESYGYCSIETSAVEEIPVLTSKGESADKEIYTISRLAAEDSEKETKSKKNKLGLHYDLTVPFARYVAQNFSKIDFPFKRYQIQKVWRGERPQEGRFREFYQCDIDVINQDNLPLFFDVEILKIMHQALSLLDLGKIEIRVSNRKILQGSLEALGIKDIQGTIRILDKKDKHGDEKIASLLEEHLEEKLDQTQIKSCIELTNIKSSKDFARDILSVIKKPNAELEKGIEELKYIISEIDNSDFADDFIVDLSIARGFDYYSGSIFEAKFTDFPQFSTIASGGRYDKLASSFIKNELPGIGMSIGLTRIFSKALREGLIKPSAKSPTNVLIAWLEGREKKELNLIANKLRERNFNVELYHCEDKLKKQIRYADRKGIKYVLFPGKDSPDEVKNLEDGKQEEINIKNFDFS